MHERILNFPGCVELVFVSKTRHFERPYSASSNDPQTASNAWNTMVEVLSSVGAQDKDTRGYYMSDRDDIEFHRGIYQLDVDGVIRPGNDTPFSPKTFNGFQMGRSAENSILLDDGEDKENSPPKNNSLCENNTNLCIAETSSVCNNMFLNMLLELCFNMFYCVCVLIWNKFELFQFFITFSKN